MELQIDTCKHVIPYAGDFKPEDGNQQVSLHTTGWSPVRHTPVPIPQNCRMFRIRLSDIHTCLLDSYNLCHERIATSGGICLSNHDVMRSTQTNNNKQVLVMTKASESVKSVRRNENDEKKSHSLGNRSTTVEAESLVVLDMAVGTRAGEPKMT